MGSGPFLGMSLGGMNSNMLITDILLRPILTTYCYSISGWTDYKACQSLEIIRRHPRVRPFLLYFFWLASLLHVALFQVLLTPHPRLLRPLGSLYLHSILPHSHSHSLINSSTPRFTTGKVLLGAHSHPRFLLRQTSRYAICISSFGGFTVLFRHRRKPGAERRIAFGYGYGSRCWARVLRFRVF